MDVNELKKIIEKVDSENSIFADKSQLDAFSIPAEIIGREKETNEIAKQLSSYKQGHVVPVISVYGRSGSGKSTLVSFVCKNMPEIAHFLLNYFHKIVGTRTDCRFKNCETRYQLLVVRYHFVRKIKLLISSLSR